MYKQNMFQIQALMIIIFEIKMKPDNAWMHAKVMSMITSQFHLLNYIFEDVMQTCF